MAELEEIKKEFNTLKNNFSKEKIKKIRKKFRFREGIDEYLKELEEKNSLAKQEEREKNITSKNLKRLKSF